MLLQSFFGTYISDTTSNFWFSKNYTHINSGGVFGNETEPLHPTQRFWNLKQLGATPEGVFAMPISSDKTDVTCAAMGSNRKVNYTTLISGK